MWRKKESNLFWHELFCFVFGCSIVISIKFLASDFVHFCVVSEQIRCLFKVILRKYSVVDGSVFDRILFLPPTPLCWNGLILLLLLLLFCYCFYFKLFCKVQWFIMLLCLHHWWIIIMELSFFVRVFCLFWFLEPRTNIDWGRRNKMKKNITNTIKGHKQWEV